MMAFFIFPDGFPEEHYEMELAVIPNIGEEVCFTVNQGGEDEGEWPPVVVETVTHLIDAVTHTHSVIISFKSLYKVVKNPSHKEILEFYKTLQKGDSVRVEDVSDGRRSAIKKGQILRIISVRHDHGQFLDTDLYEHRFRINVRDEESGAKPTPIRATFHIMDGEVTYYDHGVIIGPTLS